MSRASADARACDDIASEALDLIAHLLSGEATAADVGAIRDWRERSVVHQAAFGELARTWRGLKLALLSRDLENPS